MDIAILVLSIISGLFFAENYFLKRKAKRQQDQAEENEIENKLTKLSIERLKIRNDVDRIPLDELVARKRDGENGGDNN